MDNLTGRPEIHFWCWTSILTSSRFDLRKIHQHECVSVFSKWQPLVYLYNIFYGLTYSIVYIYMFILSPGNLGGGRQGTGGPFEPSGIRAPRHEKKPKTLQKPWGNPGVSGFPGPRFTIWKWLIVMDCLHSWWFTCFRQISMVKTIQKKLTWFSHVLDKSSAQNPRWSSCGMTPPLSGTQGRRRCYPIEWRWQLAAVLHGRRQRPGRCFLCR